MANKKFWLRMLIMLLVFGIVAVACDNGTGSGGGNGIPPAPRSITITGIPDTYNGWDAGIHVATILDEYGIVAYREHITVSGNSVTLNLLDVNRQLWTGSGNFILAIWFEDGNISETYLFTNGVPITAALLANPPRYNITDSNIIPFNLFRHWTD